jgi:hypothetical protein
VSIGDLSVITLPAGNFIPTNKIFSGHVAGHSGGYFMTKKEGEHAIGLSQPASFILSRSSHLVCNAQRGLVWRMSGGGCPIYSPGCQHCLVATLC